jgi:hypothetical protein
MTARPLICRPIGDPTMHIDAMPDPVADEMRVIAFVLRRLRELRPHLTYGERLKIAEALRDCGDALDHGAAVQLLRSPCGAARHDDDDGQPGGAFPPVDIVEVVPPSCLPRPRVASRPAARRP